MRSRVRVSRRVLNPPTIKGLKPYGREVSDQVTDPINLLYEEYEALRLSDYDDLNHYQASVAMGISRPTFTRIYGSALKKIAKAFVEGREIFIEGGKIHFDSNWYHCEGCKAYFNNPEKEIPITNCPLCKSTNIYEFNIE